MRQRFSIIGNSEALEQAVERAVRVAPIDLSVLVTGESGSGKEFFPKIIHYFGARKHKKYIAVNCGAIPEGTIDSELFGHEKGSFTGAVASRKGYFEEADGGTIFLDEVAELPLTTQARLLRVLETGEFLKVGSSAVQRTDIRIVAATNVDLLQAVAEGKFREDLYYRLSTILIHVPPLRERGDDITLLARKFASDFSQRYMTPPVTFSDDARRALRLYQWPGNVRQLKNIVEQLALFHAGSEIRRDDVLSLLPTGRRQGTDTVTSMPAQNLHTYGMERDMIWHTMLAMRSEIADLRRRLDGLAPASPAGEAAGGEELAPVLDRSISLVPAADYAVNHFVTPDAPAPAADSGRESVIDALRRSGGNKRRAAELLGISTRTLYRKIREYGLDEFRNAEAVTSEPL